MDSVDVLIRKVKDANATNFVELARIAGLNPASDFRFANLKGVDFSNQDLNGFDFTGALLNECSFLNANIRGAIFAGAEVDEHALTAANDYNDLQNRERAPGVRDPERTRGAILKAATAEFAANGFAGASINEIASRANVNKRMLYHYFGKKDELHACVSDRALAKFSEKLSELDLTHIGPRHAIEAFIKFTWDYYLINPDFVQIVIFQNVLNDRYQKSSVRLRTNPTPLETLEDIVHRGEVAGVFRRHVDAKRLYIAVAALCVFQMSTGGTFLLGSEGEAKDTEDQRAALGHIFDLVLGYLQPTE